MMEYVFVDDLDSYRTGKILETVGECYFLVQFDDMSGLSANLPAEMIHISEMVSVLPDGSRTYGFFKSRDDMNAWISYLDSPRKPSVVNLIKK